jgi:hypothetical protein
MRHSRAFTMNSKGVVERPHRQKRSLGATIQRSAHRAFAEVRRTSGMCHQETFEAYSIVLLNPLRMTGELNSPRLLMAIQLS